MDFLQYFYNICSWGGRYLTLRVRYVYYGAWTVAYSRVRDAYSRVRDAYSSVRYMVLVYGILL